MPRSTYEPIFTETLSSNQSSITFSSIPQGYKDLVLVSYAATAGTNGSLCIRVGNSTTDSGSNYGATYHYGNDNGGTPTTVGTPTQSGSRATNQSLFAISGWSEALTIGRIAYGRVNIANYSSSSNFKSFVGECVVTDDDIIESWVGSWRSNSPINVITLFNNGGGTLASGSTFSVYGLKGA